MLFDGRGQGLINRETGSSRPPILSSGRSALSFWSHTLSESTNAVGLPELQIEVGRFVGYGSTPANWSASQEAHINSLINSGVRRVYFSAGHQWSWMRKQYTISITEGTTDYDLPDDFGRFFGNLHYSSEAYQAAIVQTSVGDILDMRCGNERVQAPWCFSTRFKTTTGATGSRQEMLVYPTPDADYTVYGEYDVYTGALSDTYPYPAGGAELSELYIESCLAVAEQKTTDVPGIHTQLYMNLLQEAVRRDKARGPSTYGWMGNRERYSERMRREDCNNSSKIYYNGTEIE